MQILDYVATNDEFWMLTVNGQKGVNYDMDGDFVIPRTTPEAMVQKVGGGSFYNPLNAVDTSMTKHTTNKELLDLKAKLNVGYEPLKDILGVAILTTKAKYWANLQTLEDAYLIKAVTGEADTDKAFDDFKANWLKSGGQEMTDEVTKGVRRAE